MTFEVASRHFRQGEFAAAQKVLRQLVKNGQSVAAAWRLLGIIEGQQENFDTAAECFTSSLKYDSASIETWYYLGLAHQKLAQHEPAIAAFEKASKLAPDFFEAIHNLGLSLLALGKSAEAARRLGQAASLRPNSFEAHLNHGVALGKLGLYDAEIASYDKALAIHNAHPNLLENYGIALCHGGRFPEAVTHYRSVLKQQPSLAFARGGLLFAQANAADWDGFDEEMQHLRHDIMLGKDCISPFELMALSSSAEDQLQAARRYSEKYYPLGGTLHETPRPSADRLRIAYLSADFSTHATAFLLARVIELHDRSRFEVTAVSTGKNDQSPMRHRLEHAFERFIDAREQSDQDIARLIADLGIDILIDLKGYTTDARPAVLAQRPAPIQISYLGFPGTMGTACIDYLIADEFIVPPAHRRFYAEKIIYLPHTYQPNDATREISERPLTRADAGLADGQFVYCNFNNGYKITPAFFDIWMRLLSQTPDSVLWLMGKSQAYEDKLRNAAVQRGISADRLVFAPHVDAATHLRRLQLADLSLDNLPYNAHTTASDALWVGLPLVTCVGNTFAGRVAGSLLTAAGLPELIADTPAAYERLALDLAHDCERLRNIRQRLTASRKNCPLFDSQAYVRSLEQAYAQAWARHQMDEPPDHIVVTARDAKP